MGLEEKQYFSCNVYFHRALNLYLFIHPIHPYLFIFSNPCMQRVLGCFHFPSNNLLFAVWCQFMQIINLWRIEIP